MKRFTIFLLSALMIIGAFGVFVGCGDSARQTANGKTLIRYWSSFAEGSSKYEWHQELLKEFEKRNPDITIEHVGISFWDYFTKIQTGMIDKNGPDIYLQDLSTVKDRAMGGVSMPLDEFFTDDTINRSLLNNQDLEVASYDGKTYALPFAPGGRFLYYNKQHLMDAGFVDENGEAVPPKTYEQLIEYSKKLTVKEGRKIKRLGFDPNIGNNHILNFIWNNGGECFDENDQPIISSNSGVRKGFEEWYKVSRVNPIEQVNAFIDAGGSDLSSEGMFYAQMVSMMISTNEVPWQIDKLSEDKRPDYGVTFIPFDKEEHKCHFAGGFSYEMTTRLQNESQKVKEAAWKFIEYMYSKEVQSTMLERISYMPARTDLYAEMAENEQDLNKQFVISGMQFRRHVDYIQKAPAWHGPVARELQEYVAGRKSLDEALEDAQHEIEVLIRTY